MSCRIYEIAQKMIAARANNTWRSSEDIQIENMAKRHEKCNDRT